MSLLSPAVSPQPAPRIRFERKRASGWPMPRATMRDRACVAERMAEDLAAMIDARGVDAVVTDDDYRRLGWSREQIATHALDAARRLATRKARRLEPEAS